MPYKKLDAIGFLAKRTFKRETSNKTVAGMKKRGQFVIMAAGIAGLQTEPIRKNVLTFPQCLEKSTFQGKIVLERVPPTCTIDKIGHEHKKLLSCVWVFVDK
nr:MAG TPA: hypothetical protein [Caudoviricetes sp.]